MTHLLALWGCGGAPSDASDGDAADAISDSDTDTDLDTDTDTDADSDADADTSSTGSAGTGGTAATADTAATSSTGDTGLEPGCAGTPPTDTGFLQDTGLPVQTCDLVPPASTNPGPVVPAASIRRARIDGQPDQECGYAVVGLGDNDGDGWGELAVGCPSDYSAGEVWVFSGAQTGVLRRANAVSILTQGTSSQYPIWDGQHLEVGRLTNVAARDLIVSGHSGGATYVLPLPVPLGTSSLDTAAAVLEPIHYRNAHGVPSVGDYDGDGQQDLAVSGYEPSLYDVPPGLGAGGVEVYLGPLSGVLDPVLDADVQLEISGLDNAWGATQGPYWSGGWTRGFVGDVDDDGTSDILFGGDEMTNYAPPPSVQYGIDATNQHGGVVLFSRGVVGRRNAADATAVLYGTCFADITGLYQAVVGDVTGDCVPDIATASTGWANATPLTGGAVFVLSGERVRRARGHVPITRLAEAVLFGEAFHDLFSAVGHLGDLDQDGHDDLVVGAQNAGGRGRVYIFRGPVTGWIHARDADLILEGGTQDEAFGRVVRGAGDLDGDGVPDLLVGSFLSSWNGTSSGSAYVFSGVDLVAAM